MKTVTYQGPNDPVRDPSTAYVIDDHTLPLGVPTEVPDDVAKKCDAVKDHSFEVSSKQSKTPSKGEKKEG